MPGVVTCVRVYRVLFLLIFRGFTAASLPNVAPSGTASQSSLSAGGVASRAIDGNRDPEYTHGSCTHTYVGYSEWWSLLLPAVYRIMSISITNRNIVPERINNAAILVGNFLENNGNNNPTCAVISSIPAGGTKTFQCGGMLGRVVNVHLTSPTGGAILTLCELEVYGELVPLAPTFSAAVMGRNVAVVGRKLCWSDALFYCRDFHWDLLSVRGEEEQRAVDGVLGNASFPLTERVWVGLRRDLMGDRWFWMCGAPLSYTNRATEAAWQETSPCGGIDTGAPFHWGDLPCGDHLHFICLADMQTDTKRVEFYSSARP